MVRYMETAPGVRSSGKKTKWPLWWGIIGFAVLIIAAYLLLNPTKKLDAATLVDDAPVLGPASAPVTIVEFSDYQCPACKATEPIVKQIIDNYVNSGKVRLAYRDFPLTNLHEFSWKAAEASKCAREQGKFWEYHDLLFQMSPTLDLTSLEKYASSLGLNTQQFNSCLESGKYYDAVKIDQNTALSIGSQGTPTFVINDQRIDGGMPYDQLAQIIESKLR